MPVHGTPGGALGNASWAVTADAARIGGDGEKRTADLLNPLCWAPDAATVLHDVDIPGSFANIDHILISGNRVWLVDSKVWKPGTYWTLLGTTRRGFEKVPHADKRTMVMANERLTKFLTERRQRFNIVTPTLIVWPSKQNETMSLRWARTPGAKIVTPQQFQVLARKFCAEPADPTLARVLTELVRKSGTGVRH